MIRRPARRDEPERAATLNGFRAVHPDVEACAAFRARFGGLPGARALTGRFEDLGSHDCFVTGGTPSAS